MAPSQSLANLLDVVAKMRCDFKSQFAAREYKCHLRLIGSMIRADKKNPDSVRRQDF